MAGELIHNPEIGKQALGDDYYSYLSKTSQIIFDLHPGFSHMEDEKGNKLHLFKKYLKMMCFFLYKPSLVLIAIYFNRFCVIKAFAKKN